MIFRRLFLENIFSYRHAEFDFGGETADKNIVLIFGRNGYGKTSLTNAIKLLFAGPNDDMRSSILPGAKPKADEYVLGMGDEWMGIFNAHARRDGERDCWVRLVFEESGVEVEVERRWSIMDGGYKEELKIDIHGDATRHLVDEDAQHFLNERLPEDYLPFFFFDGEQIQRLAEANRSQTTREIERLLQLSPVDTLAEYLEKVARAWRNSDMPSHVKAVLARLERERAELEARAAEATDRQEVLTLEREDLERLIEQEDLYLDSRRTGQLVAAEGPLRVEHQQRREELEVLQLRIAEALPTNAFLLANSGLVSKAVEDIKKLFDNPSGAQAEILQDIYNSLPTDLFKSPHPSPLLTENQVRFYRERLAHLLQAYIPSPGMISDGVIQLETSRARQLLTLLEHALQSSQERDDRVMQLREAVRLKNHIRTIQDKLDDISSMPNEEQQEYIERKADNNRRRERIGAIGKEHEEVDKSLRDFANKIEAKGNEIRAQEKKVSVSEKNRRKLDRTEALKRFFARYKNELKKTKRAAIEEAINRRFRELMTSHGLIAHIRVDEFFGVHYLDAQGNPVGMASISAGMKQLAATALLWALKEVSEKDVPIVIDTPLARIDRQHQENLLTRYYPQAGKQIIILPTDAEIDREKHALIAPRIYREYLLENSDGQDTKVVEAPIFPAENSHV
ncbi:MAG: DNA sulfur modification protein DndD [Rhodocyclaceae bacterium]|nr:DNA sulfur modification protein DndD [Rhodocyclaceae bacterium]